MTLADGRYTVSDGEEAGRNRAVAFGEIGVTAVLAQDNLALHGVLLLIQAEQADLAANQRTIGLIEVEQRQRGIVAGVLQPAIDEAPGRHFSPRSSRSMAEGGIRGDIDQAERLVEFDAVEQHDLAIDQRGIAR